MQLNEFLETTTKIIGIISVVAGGVYFLIKEFNKVQLKNRKKLQGRWINEGDFTLMKTTTHYIMFDIQTDIEDGKVFGVVESRNLNTDEKIINVSINGKLMYKTAIIQLHDIRAGRHFIYGKVRLKIKGKLLHWKLLKGDKDYFPVSTLCWKTEIYTGPPV